MGIQGPLMAGATFLAPEAGASAGGAALLSNPITAALAAAALGTAYGVSPTVRKKVNGGVKSLYEGVANPFQHFGDGTSADKFGNLMNGQLDLGGLGQLPGIAGGISKTDFPTGWDEGSGQTPGFLSNLLNKAKNPDQKRQQQASQAFGVGSQPKAALPPSEIPLGNYLQNTQAQMSNGFYPNLLSRGMY